MKTFLITSSIALLLAAPVAAEKTDYSRGALFEIFVAPAPPPVEGFSSRGASIEYRTGSTVFRFLPIMLPIAGTEPRHSPMPAVDPFALMGTVFPDTRATISRFDGREAGSELTLREEWQLWRTRREVEAILRTLP